MRLPSSRTPEGHRVWSFTKGVPSRKMVGSLVPPVPSMRSHVVPFDVALRLHFTPQFLNTSHKGPIRFGLP